jgi:YHS domain-containing protein
VSPDPVDPSDLMEWSDCMAPRPAIGTPVTTACGGTVQYTATTPCVYYRGQAVYFCLPICKAGLESDPRYSCLALNTGR